MQPYSSTMRAGASPPRIPFARLPHRGQPSLSVTRLCGSVLKWVVEEIADAVRLSKKGFYPATGARIATEVWPVLQPIAHDAIAQIETWIKLLGQ